MNSPTMPGSLLSPNSLARKRPLISLTPLIDVVFILLIFFMLASSFMDWRAIDLDVPVQGTNAAASDDSVLLIKITPEDYRIGDEALTLDALTSRVIEHLAVKSDQRVLINPSAGIDLQRVITLLDRMTAVGAVNMTLVRDGGG